MRAFKVILEGKELEVIQDSDGKFIKPDFIRENESLGTALKPANEPIVLARKPLEKGLTVAQNVLKWGTGALAIDASRIATDDNLNGGAYAKDKAKVGGIYGKLDYECGDFTQPQGRWPANILLSSDAANDLNAQTGRDVAKFFYCEKTSKRERMGSKHPTVKPIKLMRYLVRMVVPPNGICLDPFMGSGTTGVACKLEGFQFIGIDREEEYINDARRRIEAAEPEASQLDLGSPA